MKRKVLLHCDSCWETWEGPEYMIGKPCVVRDGEVGVRLATPTEAEGYCKEMNR